MTSSRDEQCLACFFAPCRCFGKTYEPEDKSLDNTDEDTSGGYGEGEL